jgi:hypothetical protein
MTAAFTKVESSTAAVLVDVEPEVFAHVGKDAVELVLWQRTLPADLIRWLNELPTSALPAARLELRAGEVVQALHMACDARGTPQGPMRDALLADIAGLAGRFSQITGSARVGLRLEVVADNACSRFHRDCVPLRLLTTYRGPGTDWVKPEFSDRALARPDDYPGPVKRLATHEVALFKGCGFPGRMHDSGIVHRSPPILGSGITRLLLCLDVPRARTQEQSQRQGRR